MSESIEHAARDAVVIIAGIVEHARKYGWYTETGAGELFDQVDLRITQLAGALPENQPAVPEGRMSVWQTKTESARLHWLRRCSGGPGVRRMQRVSVTWQDLADAGIAGKVCRCLQGVEFVPGKRARD